MRSRGKTTPLISRFPITEDNWKARFFGWPAFCFLGNWICPCLWWTCKAVVGALYWQSQRLSLAAPWWLMLRLCQAPRQRPKGTDKWQTGKGGTLVFRFQCLGVEGRRSRCRAGATGSPCRRYNKRIWIVPRKAYISLYLLSKTRRRLFASAPPPPPPPIHRPRLPHPPTVPCIWKWLLPLWGCFVGVFPPSWGV